MYFKAAGRREFLETNIAHMVPDTCMCAYVGSESWFHSKRSETVSTLERKYMEFYNEKYFIYLLSNSLPLKL